MSDDHWILSALKEAKAAPGVSAWVFFCVALVGGSVLLVAHLQPDLLDGLPTAKAWATIGVIIGFVCFCVLGLIHWWSRPAKDTPGSPPNPLKRPESYLMEQATTNLERAVNGGTMASDQPSAQERASASGREWGTGGYSLLALVALVIVLAALWFLLKADIPDVRYRQVYYVILVVLGVSAAFALFGVLRSTARIRGEHLKAQYEFGGPVALAIIVVLGGIFLPKPDHTEAEIAALTEGLENARAENASLAAELSTASGSLAAQNAKLSEIQTTLKAREAELTGAREALIARDAEMTRLKDEQRRNTADPSKEKQLQADLAKVRKERDDLAKQVKTLTEKLKTTGGALAEANAKWEAAKNADADKQSPSCGVPEKGFATKITQEEPTWTLLDGKIKLRLKRISTIGTVSFFSNIPDIESKEYYPGQASRLTMGSCIYILRIEDVQDQYATLVFFAL